MGFYERRVFPHLNDFVMRDPRLIVRRKRLLGEAQGRVLEVGMGSGLNLPHYPPSVERVLGIDPNPGMNERAQQRAARAPFPVEVRRLVGESLPLDAASVDTVVCTFVLCTIEGVGAALSEIRRVLVPHGRLLVLEHGLSADPNIQVWQHRLNPLERLVACGCNLDRDIAQLVKDAGFSFEALHTEQVHGLPKTHGFLFEGIARK